MQYVSKICVQLGIRFHPVAQGECCEIMDTMTKLVHEEIHHFLQVKTFAIALTLEKT